MDGSEYPQTILKLSFGTTKTAAYANEILVCLLITKSIELITGLNIRSLIKLIFIDIMYSISYQFSSMRITATL